MRRKGGFQVGLSQLSRSVSGKTVVVTGAGSGMGRATAFLFADEGAHVVGVDVNADALMETVTQIQDEYGKSSAVQCVANVATPDGRQMIHDAALSSYQTVDVLVNNAGISKVSSVRSDEETFTQNWDTTIAINLSAHAHLIRLFLPQLLECESGGRIVNIASTEAIVATSGLAAYTASKHGVIGLTKSFAVELGGTGITVNAICPGPIETGMTASIDQESKQKYARRRVSLRRYGQPEEVAHMTLSLCLPAASFITGATVVVDGGMTIRH